MRSLLVSVPRRLLGARSSTTVTYLKAISDLGLDIELFTEARPGNNPVTRFVPPELENVGHVAQARELGLEVETVHATPLYAGCSTYGAKACADAVVDAQFEYVDKDGEETGSRERYCDASLFVFHPPRFYASEDRDLETLRQRLVGTLANTRMRLEDDDLIDEVPALTIENVCPRGPFDYLLSESADVNRFDAARRDLQAVQSDDVIVPPVDYTLDIGHAPNPFAMLDAMGTPEHVHLHGSIPVDDKVGKRELRERYSIDDGTALGSIEPSDEIQHLPPQHSQHDLTEILNALDDADYTEPITLELARPYRTAEILTETVKAIRDHA